MQSVHPFPARMATELVDELLAAMPRGRVLLDPMMGSGTFVLGAASRGHYAIGIDSDPLAYIVAAAAAGEYDKDVAHAESMNVESNALSLVGLVRASDDVETLSFIDFWFDPQARDELAALAASIGRSPVGIQAPLWCGLSRLIITKDKGVSRARDVSHSRPHRVRDVASFSPIARFVSSVSTVLKRSHSKLPGQLTLHTCDARRLPIQNESVDGIMTSPPYLIAIDYLRGHRLSLVWMGYAIGELRSLRSSNVGTERGSELPTDLQSIVETAVTGEISRRKLRTLNTYVQDIDLVVKEQSRVLRSGGSVTYVVANARHGSTGISVEAIVSMCAERHGLTATSRYERRLPERRRYLPPPREGESALDRRMHTEVVVSFLKQ